jgi:hypothetical protein
MAMGREVRRVPMDWQHPMEWREQWDRADQRVKMKLVPKPLHNRDILRYYDEGEEIDESTMMPVFPEGTATGFCMYEDTSEGTPISPVFETPEELARWLADTGASAFGQMTATYEEWLSMARAGWAPSAISTGGELHSGVAAMRGH